MCDHRPTLLGLELPATLGAHGRVVGSEIRRTCLYRPPLAPSAWRRPWSNGTPREFHRKLDNRIRARGLGHEVIGDQSKVRTRGDKKLLLLAFHLSRRRGRNGMRTRGRKGRESAHEYLLEHMFDEHLFDTIAADGRYVQNFFEHMFEVPDIPP
jgi:hypothetical protein